MSAKSISPALASPINILLHRKTFSCNILFRIYFGGDMQSVLLLTVRMEVLFQIRLYFFHRRNDGRVDAVFIQRRHQP